MNPKPVPVGLTAALSILLVLVLTGCGQPTREELLESQEAKRQYCDEMLADIQRNKGRPLIRATLQENYNRECLGHTYPDEVQ